jgi:hypothetical protein
MTRHMLAFAGLIGAAVAAAAPAQAATYNFHANFSAANLRCGYFVKTVNCAVGTVVGSVESAKAGDVFNLSASFDERIRVGPSKTSALAYIGIADSTIVLGQGAGSGPYNTRYATTLQGYQGARPIFGGPFSLRHGSSYIGIVGHVGGVGLPSDGFSYTGVGAQLIALTDAPRTVGVLYTGYAYEVPNTPTEVVGVQGGSEDSPVILPPGQVGQVTANIGGAFGADQYYGFRWSNGGLFQTQAEILNADPSAVYRLRLLSSARDVLQELELNAGNGFKDLLSIGSLAIGDYVIGIATGGASSQLVLDAKAKSFSGATDTQFTLSFNTPVGSVPEPESWAMMIVGLGFAGAAVRRRGVRAASALGRLTAPPRRNACMMKPLLTPDEQGRRRRTAAAP